MRTSIADGAIVYRQACALGCEGIVSKRLGSPYRSGRADCWLKVKNPAALALGSPSGYAPRTLGGHSRGRRPAPAPTSGCPADGPPRRPRRQGSQSGSSRDGYGRALQRNPVALCPCPRPRLVLALLGLRFGMLKL
jgi:hypothetical protein